MSRKKSSLKISFLSAFDVPGSCQCSHGCLCRAGSVELPFVCLTLISASLL